MNKKIIRKLIEIGKLKYEIITDILPEKTLHKLNNFENEAATIIKDITLDLMRESSEKAKEEAGQEKAEKEIKRVKVDFL